VSINLPPSSGSGGAPDSTKSKKCPTQQPTISRKQHDGDSWMSLFDTVIRQIVLDFSMQMIWLADSFTLRVALLLPLFGVVTLVHRNRRLGHCSLRSSHHSMLAPGGRSRTRQRSTPKSQSAQNAEAETALQPQQKSLTNCLQDGRVPGCVRGSPGGC